MSRILQWIGFFVCLVEKGAICAGGRGGGVEISSRNVDPKALLAISAWRRQYPRSDNHLTLSRGGVLRNN